ncbi:hypothetical protein B6N60_04844 [Richelia sinica FACHB-800]|uniref:Uncharacterized protein n=1 Tax=Richelia sinica FACHB-800 TaxID=1357546 RepID=A0A975Y798_9NOST|nr:hypothetical protein [Richelia sinica]MBD2667231.1 hypothetical protein [Richelia sinica FACHB-800]QXE26113.1 hypothetical protein B6N60_04844 [Richelia sinica FACHB-800]
MKSVLIATIGTRDLMFQIASGEWFNVGDDRMQNGEIIGEQAEVLSDLGLHNVSFRELTKYLLDNIDTYIERLEPAITGNIFNKNASEIEKVYLIATDQKPEVKQREKDTLYTTEIIKKWIIRKFQNLNNDNISILYVGQDGTNPSDFEQMFNWWRKTWRKEIHIQPHQPIWVCVKGGVGQTSEAARVSGLSFYGDRILFFEVQQNTRANRNGIPSDYSGPFLGTNYLWDRNQKQALKLLESYDYTEAYDLLEPYFQQPSANFGLIPNLLKAGKLWNQGQFERFLSLARSSTQISSVQGRLWMAYEQAYLGVIRLRQKNTTEAMLHSYRAIEGLLYWWAADSFPDYVQERKNQYPLIKDSILQKYPSLKNYFTKPERKTEVKLQGWLLEDLLNEAIPETANSIDFQKFWNSAKDARNNFSHRLGGLAEEDVFEAWGEDIINSEQWQKRILNCINLVTGKSFKNLSQASIFSQIHTQVLEAIEKQEIINHDNNKHQSS